MSLLKFTPAVRTDTHIIAVFYAMSGGGKTLSSLLFARGLVGDGGKIGMIDTETGRGSIYADDVPGGYAYAELSAPFTPERYIEAIKDAEAAGIQALVIDSTSHVWAGLGGIVEIADAGRTQDGKALDGLIKWSGPKKRYKLFMQTILNSRMHLILCMRAKEKMIQGKNPNNNGKYEVYSDGFVPIQEKTFIYEATVQIFMPVAKNTADRGKYIVEKCPKGLLSAFPGGDDRISVETGSKVRTWVGGAAVADKGVLDLRNRARQAAEQGTEALRGFWEKTATKEDKHALKDELANLKSIAAVADSNSEPDEELGFDGGEGVTQTAGATAETDRI